MDALTAAVLAASKWILPVLAVSGDLGISGNGGRCARRTEALGVHHRTLKKLRHHDQQRRRCPHPRCSHPLRQRKMDAL